MMWQLFKLHVQDNVQNHTDKEFKFNNITLITF